MSLESWIIFNLITGSIGMGYIVYGKKQQRVMALVSGLGLCLFPYFVTSLVWSIIIALILVALPFVVRH